MPGKELQPLVGRQLEKQDRHVVGDPVDLLHAAGQGLDRDVLGRAHGARLDHQIAERFGLAEKRLAGLALRRRQGLFLVDAVIHAAGDDLPLAGAAGAVLAAVRKYEALPQRRGEDGLAFFDLENVAARLEGNGRHRSGG